MPGLDAFESLDPDTQAATVATLRHWADLPHGKRLSDARVNEEHDDPKIFALKAGKHRFTVFHAGGDVWVVHRHYEKRKAKLDKAGKAVVKTTITAMRDFEKRVKGGIYYERG